MESGRAPCCCCYCKAATQAFFSRKKVKNRYTKSTLHSQRDFLLYLLCFLLFFLTLLGGTSLGFQSFTVEMEDFISSFILFDTAFLWLNKWNVGVQKSKKTGRHGVPGFFSGTPNQNSNKADFKTYRKTKWKEENWPHRLFGFSLFFIKPCELDGGSDGNNYLEW